MTASWNRLSDKDLELVDGWCDQFERRWKQGEPSTIESILRNIPSPLKGVLCRELVFLELDLRRSRGEELSSAEYSQRFPEIAADILNRERELAASSLLRVSSKLTPIASSVFKSNPADSDEINRGLVPRQIAKYQILEKIGVCEVGVNLRAMDPKLRRIVAATVLHPDLAANPGVREEFLIASQAVATISDPHVASVFETCEADGVVCLFREYFIGQSLQAHIDQGMTFSPTDIARIGWQTASGLAAAHQQGVIHGGLSPASLLLENGLARVKIVGFGMRRVLELASVPTTIDEIPQGASVPAREHRPTVRSDLVNLGHILYTLCTGELTIGRETGKDRTGRISGPPVRPVQDLNPRIPAWLAATVDRLLADSLQNRFPSACAVATSLGNGLANSVPDSDPSLHARIDLPVVAHRPNAVSCSRLTWLSWAGFGIVAALSGWCLWTFIS